MAATAESDPLFSLDSYHVSEELGFILPEPLVGGKAQWKHAFFLIHFFFLPYTHAVMMKYL